MVDTSGFEKCDNGHLYDPKQHQECPYCPRPTVPGTAESSRKTPTANMEKATVAETTVEASPTTPGGGATFVEGAAPSPPPPQPPAEGQGTVVEQPQPPSGEGRQTRVLTEADQEKIMPIFAWLVVLEGRQQYQVFRIEKEQTYVGGSAECDIVIDDDYVSSEHASIRYRDGKFFITDLDSKNGTFVNKSEPDARIDRVELKDGDEVYIGQAMMKFKCL